MFSWGVFLFFFGMAALIGLVVIRILLGQLVRMASRLEPTTGTVRTDDSAVARKVEQFVGRGFHAPFLYDYEVGGTRYTGSLVTLQADDAAKTAASAALAAHKPGDTIAVFYDRLNPGRAVIDGTPPVVPGWVRFGPLIAGVAAIVGGVMMFAG